MNYCSAFPGLFLLLGKRDTACVSEGILPVWIRTSQEGHPVNRQGPRVEHWLGTPTPSGSEDVGCFWNSQFIL